MAKIAEGKNNMMTVLMPWLIPLVISTLITAGGGLAAFSKMQQSLQDHCEKQKIELASLEKESTAIKKDGSDISRKNEVAIAEVKVELRNINLNLTEQKALTERQMELSQKIFEKVNRP